LLDDADWDAGFELPMQGEWSEGTFLRLDNALPRFVELTDGHVTFLGWPTLVHHRVLQFLLKTFSDHVDAHMSGVVLQAPCPVQLRPGVWRMPDVAWYQPLRFKEDPQRPHGADLVVEVLSDEPAWRRHDIVAKRTDYAAAGIPEYWIVDPETTTITVLSLPEGGSEYAVHGEFQPGQTATSVLLDGFTVDVDACFAAAEAASTENTP